MSLQFKEKGWCRCERCGADEKSMFHGNGEYRTWREIDGETILCSKCFIEWERNYPGPYFMKYIPGFADFEHVPVATFSTIEELVEKLDPAPDETLEYEVHNDAYMVISKTLNGEVFVSGYVRNFDMEKSSFRRFDISKELGKDHVG